MKKVWHSPALMSWLALGVRLGGFVLLLPLVLANFSDAEVSVWLLFSAIANLQTIADFGFGPTFSREIAYGFAGHSLVEQQTPELPLPTEKIGTKNPPNWPAIATATTAMLWLYRRIALAAFSLLVIFGTWAAMLPIERILHPQSAWIAWCVVALTTGATIYGNAYASFLIGANQIGLQKRWEALISGISLSTQILVVVLDMGLIGLVLVAQGGLVAQILVNRMLVFHVAEGHFSQHSPNDLNRKVLRAMWPAAWRTAIGAIMSLGVSQGMSIAMANVLATAQAASVQLALRVMHVISQFSQVPYYTRIPELNRLRASGKEKQMAVLASKAMQLSLWIFSLGAIFVDLMGRQLLNIIGSQTQLPSQTFWLILMLAIFAERYGAMHIQLLLTSNRAIAHIANGVTGLIWIVMMVVLYPEFGASALPTSMLIAYAGFYTWYASIQSHSALSGVSPWQFELKSGILPSLFVIIWVAYMYIQSQGLLST